MWKIRTDKDDSTGNLYRFTKADLELQVLAQTAAPGVIGVRAVRGVIDNSVDSVTLKEAGLLACYEVRYRVREILRYVVPVMRVLGNHTLRVDLVLAGLGYCDAVIVTGECTGCIAGLELPTLRHCELKYSVGCIDDRFLHCRVESDLHKLSVTKLDTELVARLILAVKMLVDLIAVCLESDVAVLTNDLKVDYGDPLL